MHITIDTAQPLSAADKRMIAALVGDNTFPSQSERLAAGTAVKPAVDEQAAAREDGVGRRVQAERKAAKAAEAAQQTATDDSSDEADEAEASAEPVDLRARVTEVAEALVEAGRSKDIAKVLTSLGVRLVRRLKDHQLEEALAKLEALTEPGKARPAKPDLDDVADDDDDEPADAETDDDDEEDEDSDPLDDVSADDDEDDDEEADKALLEKAFNRARQLLDTGKRSKVVAALKEVGARKVTELEAEQVPGFLKILKGE